MIIKNITLLLFCLLPMHINASSSAIGGSKTSTTKCNPSPFGTFCELQVKVKPSKEFSDYTYCGRTYVAITPQQRKVLNAYLTEHKNMVLRFSLDDEFINAPCF